MAKNTLFTIIMIFISVIITLIGGEILVRQVVPFEVAQQKEAYLYFEHLVADKDYGRRLKPNYKTRIIGRGGIDFNVTVNSKGLRGREVKYEKDKNTIRIMAIGDSFTYGYGADNYETFPKILEVELNRKYEDIAVEVINAGVTGWGTIQEKKYLLREGNKYDPDIIIVGFYLNDIQDVKDSILGKADYAKMYETKRKLFKKIARHNISVYLDLVLRNNTYLYPFLKYHILKFSETRQKAKYSILGSTINPDYLIDNIPKEGISIIEFDKKIEKKTKIFGYEIFSLVENEVKLNVWRKYDNKWKVVANSKNTVISAGLNKIYLETPIIAEAGDYIGFFNKNGNITREFPYSKKGKIYGLGDIKTIGVNDGRRDTAGGYSFKVYLEKQVNINHGANEPKVILNEKSVFSLFMDNITNMLDLTHNSYQSKYANAINNFKCSSNDLIVGQYCKEENKIRHNAYIKTLDELKSIHEIAVKNNTKILFVYLTPIYEAAHSLVENKQVDLERPYKIFSEYMKMNEIMHMATNKGFKESNDDFLFISDSHYNKNGYKLVANEILPEITKMIDSIKKSK